MKKLFTLVLTLAALLSSTQVLAESYDLYVGGKQVTDDNKNNITSSAITGGTVYYNPSSKVLYIGNGTDITREGDCINSSIDGLKIVFLGSATITSTSGASQDAGLYLSGETTLTFSSGKSPVVTIKNTGAGNAIRTNNRLAILGNRLTATAANNDAIYGRSSGNLLVISYSSVFATGGSGKAGITGFQSIILTASVLHPDQTISGGTVMKGGSAAQAATINCAATIGGLNVSISSTTLSASNTGATSASGTATYNSSTKTLTLTNVNVDGAELVTHGDMTINFVGGGTISSSGYTMDLYGNTTLNSDGKVIIKSTDHTSVYLNYDNTNLEICMPEFQATCTTDKDGVYGSSNCKLILKKYNNNSVYKFLGGRSNVSVPQIVLDDMDIWSPHTWIKEGKVYYNDAIASSSNGPSDGTWFKSKNQFTYYPLYVAGTQVNHRNNADIRNQYITSGTVKYDTSAKTLTLDGATISGQPSEATNENCAIYSQIPDLTINATGTNNWTTGHTCVNLGGGGTYTIKGSGILNIISTGYNAINVWNKTNLILARSGGEMTMKAKKNGFNGTPNAALTINKEGSGANYQFIGDEGDIVDIPTLTFGSGVNFWTLYRWFNADEQKVYRKDAMAKASEGGGTWIRSDVTWTTYPIYIAGTQLYSSDNFGNSFGFWNKYVKGGTITYNPSTKTLTLNGATIESVGSHGIEMKLEGNIKLVGTNSLSAKTTTNSKYSAICANKFNITITGDGSLNATSDKNCGIHAHEGIVTITDNVKIDATGDCGGLGSILSDYAGTFIISGNAQVKANKITNVATLTLEDGQTIVEPFKAAFNSSNKRVEVNGAVAQNVVIQKVEKYDLAVCDVDVNSYNKDDILRDGGAFKYDPSIKRLTITEADIDDPDVSEGVYNKGIEGLNIAIEGENHFRVVDDVFKMKNSTSFSGNGSVKGELIANDGWGIYMVEGSSAYACTLNGPSFEFTGELAVGGPTNNLVIDKGCLIFNPNSSSDATMVNINNLKFGTGMYIAKPEGGVFRGKRIRLNNNVYRGLTIICQKGDVNLDGTVTIADAVAVLNAMAGQEVPGNPNVNGDSEVSIADFVAVLNIMAGQ